MVKTSVKPLPLFRLITVSYLARTLLVQANSANVFDLLPMISGSSVLSEASAMVGNS